MSSVTRLTHIVTFTGLVFGLVAVPLSIAVASQKDFSVKIAQVANRKSSTDEGSVVENNDYRFQLKGCRRKNSSVICDLLITNLTGSDRWLKVGPYTRILDASGNEYFPRLYSFGNRQETSAVVEIGNTLPQGIAIKSVFTFEVPKDVIELPILELPYQYPKGYLVQGGKVEFRNIKIGSDQQAVSPKVTNPEAIRGTNRSLDGLWNDAWGTGVWRIQHNPNSNQFTIFLPESYARSSRRKGPYEGRFIGENTIEVKFYDDPANPTSCCTATLTSNARELKWSNGGIWSR